MDFRILGPLEVSEAGRSVPIVGAKQRALLAILLLHANESVSSDWMIEHLWGEQPPAGTRKNLQVLVSRLRKALGPGDGPIVTRPPGYLLRVEPGQLDLERFERLSEEGRQALAAEDPQRAAERFRDALALWRGPPLADLTFESFAQPEIRRLEESRLGALEDRIEADLASGRHVDLVGELETLVGEHPLRERLRRHLVTALYRAGRQADALDAWRAARRQLIDELGLEPTPELSELEGAILSHDEALQPPPASRASRLPAEATRTFGRAADVAAVAGLLREADIRLVTLLGPGGVGKTRLALEVARELEPELRDAAWFVSLAPTAKADHVASAIAHALGVQPLENETLEGAMERFLAAKRGLLVLDNCEHVLDAAPLIGELLAASGSLRVLATSREALRVRAEHRYAVAPLEAPVDDGAEAVEQAAAGAMFVERARSHDRGFELSDANAGAVAEICRRLDGLPLAIELAAARLDQLGAEELNARLAQALEVLSGGPRDAPDRQRTLRATIDWSHRLLSAEEAAAFARFAVFAGGADVEAAEAVTGAGLDVLQGLVDKQLLRRDGSGPDARLWMLETVREYARGRLDAGKDAERVQARHCEHYLALVERAEPELLTRGDAEWLPRLDLDLDNLRAAFDWSLRRGDPRVALRLAGLLELYWGLRARYAEGLRWLETALAAAGGDAPIADRARARRTQVRLLDYQGAGYGWWGSLQELRALGGDALALAREDGDPAEIAATLVVLADLEEAATLPQRRRSELAEEALIHARKAKDPRLVALALSERAFALPVEAGAAELERAAEAASEIGGGRLLVALYSNCAYDAIKAGTPQRAQALLERAVPLARELGDPLMLVLVSGNKGLAALLGGDLGRARIGFEEQLRLCREHVWPVQASEGLAGLAAIAAARGDPERAARLLGGARATGPVGNPDVEDQLEERFFAPARARHGERRWEEAQAAGAELGFEPAIALALGADELAPEDTEPAVRARRTFLFSDICRSTDLVEAVGDDAWHQLLGWHDRTLRALFAEHRGEEVDHAGDGFFVAFESADDALACAVVIQRALAAHRRDHGFAPSVRIGVHSAPATRAGGAYRGKGVHAAARITSVSEPGEIVASRETVAGATELAWSDPRPVPLRGISEPIEIVTVDWRTEAKSGSTRELR